MLKNTIKRLIIMIICLFIVITLLYFSFWFAIIEKYSWLYKDIDMFPIICDKFVEYIKDILFHWDWGKTVYGKDIAEQVAYKAHYTIKITLSSTLFFIVFGILLGYICAIKKNTMIDKIISGVTTAISAIPSFVIVWLLMLTLGWGLDIFPAIYPLTSNDPFKEVLAMFIPVMSLSLWPLSKFIQLVRGELIESLNSEFMLLARVKGLTKTQGIIRHLTKNTLVTILPEFTNSFLFVLSSSFLVEIVYNVPGVANLFYDSMISPFGDGGYVSIDIYTTIYIVCFYMAFSMIMSIVFDMFYNVLDPRMNIGQKKYTIITN